MKHQALIIIDRLAKPIYTLLNNLKWRPKKNGSQPQYIVLKFFGLGSITRIAHVLNQSEISRKEVTFVTLIAHKGIIEILNLNALYIKTGNPFQFIGSVFSTIYKVWKQKNTVILDMERASNLSGIFRLVIGINKKCSAFSFEQSNRQKSTQNFITLTNKAATTAIAEMFGTSYTIPELNLKNNASNKILVNINAGSYLPQRKFTLPEYAKLIQALSIQKPTWHFYLTGLKSEVGDTEKFKQLLITNDVPVDKISNLAGQQNLKAFVDEIKSAKLLITNDSGPLHLAYYFGMLTVGIWGPTAPLLVGYKDNNLMLNIQSNITCTPCFIHPKSSVAKHCKGQLTCFKSLIPSEMASKIVSFVDTDKIKA